MSSLTPHPDCCLVHAVALQPGQVTRKTGSPSSKLSGLHLRTDIPPVFLGTKVENSPRHEPGLSQSRGAVRSHESPDCRASSGQGVLGSLLSELEEKRPPSGTQRRQKEGQGGGGERSWDQAQGNVTSPGACPLSVWASSRYATPFRGTPEVWTALFRGTPEVWAAPSGAPLKSGQLHSGAPRKFGPAAPFCHLST